jgi:iron complex outermembrane receptor protein
MNVKRTPIASAVVLALAGAASPAFAQQAAPAPAAPASAASTAPATPEVKAQQLEAVTVTGIRASREKSLEQKRNADTLVEVVTAEDVGKMPDKNVADAIQRVPGVNIASSAGGEGGFSENDRVSIRGTSPSLTQTLINGHAVSTGDWFVLNLFGTTVGRSASYSLLPSELVGKITVHKSQTADLPEGGVAGAVNVETRRPLEFKKGFSGEVSLGAMHSTLAEKTDPQLSGLLAFRNEDRSFGVLVQLFDQKQHLRRDGSEVLGYFNINGANFGNSTTLINGVSKPTSSLDGVKAPSLIGESLFEQERHRRGGAIEVQFKPIRDLTLGASLFQSKVDDANMNTNFMASPKWLMDAGIAPTSATLSADGKTLLGASFPETGVANSIINDSGIRPGAKQSSKYYNLDAKWAVNDALTVAGQVGKTRGVGESQEFASEVGNVGAAGNTPLALTYGLNGVSQAPSVGFTSSTGKDFRSYANQYWNWNFGAQVKVPDDEKYGTLDFEWAVDKGVLESIKFGGRVTDHTRNNGNWLSSGPNWANPNVGTTLPVWTGGTYPSNFGSAFGAPFTGQFRLDPAALAQWATVSTVANPNPNATFNYDPVQRHEWSNDFEVEEKTNAGYIMGNFAGSNWRANAGVRIVQTKGHYSTLRSPTPTDPVSSVDSSSLFGPFVKEFTDRSYVDVLPSVNLKYQLTNSVTLRAAVAKTMARPDYTALSSTTSLNDQLNTGSSGNPNLDPVRSTNFDVAAEWYFAPKSLVSFGVFHQQFKSFVDYQVTSSVHFSDLHQQMETYNITQPINVGAKNTGFEVGYQQPIMGNFGVNANYTYADGKVDGGGEMSGNSKNTYNLEGFYEGEKLSARLAYSYRSSFYGSYDRGVKMHMDSVGTLAASLNYRINDTFSISLEGLNLNNPTLKYYGDNREQPRAFYTNGRQYYLTLRAKV